MKIYKFILVSLFALLSFFILEKDIYAQTNAYVKASALYIRQNPTTSSPALATIYNKESILITDLNKVSGSGCSEGWYKIQYNEITGYVCSSYVALGDVNLGYNIENFTARVYATTVSTRSTPSTSGARIDTLINGTNVKVIETLSSGNGGSMPWYKINYHNNQTAYICSEYIIKKSDVTASDSEYEQVLQNAGFPSTYWPYLVYLHNKYPNWQFNAIKTNLKWSNVISGESGKNYIEGTIYDAYRTSTTPREGKTWFEATDGVNAFYLDPRNFLTEKYIFMFENLGFDETTQGADILKSIFGSSYLSNDEYVNYFIGAGRMHNVSAAHLASRVVQEGSAKSTYESIRGDSTSTYRGNSLAGFYNYYNIGAYADSYTSSPVVRGLAYAAGIVGGDGTSYGRPWNTREKSIYGGAQFISSGYINAGQYTLYFQKFNTSPTSSYNKYTHQYMTNVQAPSSEGSNIYSSYKKNDIITNSYVFAIPVYEDMPDIVSLPTIGNVVNTLKFISINDNKIMDFDMDVVSYTYYISKTDTSISINASPTSETSIVEGLGDYNIDNDNTVITIKVTSETGDIKVYTVTVIRVDETSSVEEIFSKIGVTIKNNNITNFKENDLTNNLINNIKKYLPSSTVKVKNTLGKELQGKDILSTGQQLVIQSTNNEIKTYTIIVKGDTSGDGKITILDLLQVQKHILNSKKLLDAYILAADKSGDAQVTILDLLQVQKHIVGSKKL